MKPQRRIRRTNLCDQEICVITKWAETGRVPPTRGVMVSAEALPAGLRTVRTELIAVVVTFGGKQPQMRKVQTAYINP